MKGSSFNGHPHASPVSPEGQQAGMGQDHILGAGQAALSRPCELTTAGNESPLPFLNKYIHS